MISRLTIFGHDDMNDDSLTCCLFLFSIVSRSIMSGRHVYMHCTQCRLLLYIEYLLFVEIPCSIRRQTTCVFMSME